MDPAINRKKGKLNLSFEFDQFYCINTKVDVHLYRGICNPFRR